MVSNEKNNGHEKKSKDVVPVGGYFQCEQCRGYYELKPGESVEDYKICYCGGKLKYFERVNLDDDEDILEKYYLLLKNFFKIIVILVILAMIPVIVWYFQIRH